MKALQNMKAFPNQLNGYDILTPAPAEDEKKGTWCGFGVSMLWLGLFGLIIISSILTWARLYKVPKFNTVTSLIDNDAQVTLASTNFSFTLSSNTLTSVYLGLWDYHKASYGPAISIRESYTQVFTSSILYVFTENITLQDTLQQEYNSDGYIFTMNTSDCTSSFELNLFIGQGYTPKFYNRINISR